MITLLTFWTSHWGFIITITVVTAIVIIPVLLLTRKRRQRKSDEVMRRKCLSDPTSMWYTPACKKFRDEIERREREEMFRKG